MEPRPPECLAERPPMSNRALYRLVWVPSALACAGMGYIFAGQPYVVAKIEPMKPYVAKDNSVSLMRPGNWKGHSRSENGVSHSVVFDPAKSVHFEVSTDLAGSLFADVMKSSDDSMQSLAGAMPGGAGLNAAPQKSPLEKLHTADGKLMEKDERNYPGYEETDAKPTRISGAPALVSAFIFKGDGPDGEMHGKRYTALASDARVSILYYCPKSKQKELSGVFEKMTQSVRAGQNGGSQ